MLLLNFCLRSILWMACVFTPKLQVKLSSQFYSWSSITREETFHKFYRNIPYPNPFRLLTSLNSEPWTWQRKWRKSRVKNNRILTVGSNLHNLRRMLSSWYSPFNWKTNVIGCWQNISFKSLTLVVIFKIVIIGVYLYIKCGIVVDNGEWGWVWCEWCRIMQIEEYVIHQGRGQR